MRVCERVFIVGFGPAFDSMSPARSRRSASHAAGTNGWLPQKTGWPGLRGGRIHGYNLHSPPPPTVGRTNHVQAVSLWFNVLDIVILVPISMFDSNVCMTLMLNMTDNEFQLME